MEHLLCKGLHCFKINSIGDTHSLLFIYLYHEPDVLGKSTDPDYIR